MFKKGDEVRVINVDEGFDEEIVQVTGPALINKEWLIGKTGQLGNQWMWAPNIWNVFIEGSYYSLFDINLEKL